MKCEECLSSLELLFDGELDAPTAELLKSHMAVCASCASAYHQLNREQDFFLRYECDVAAALTFWNNVQAKITPEGIARPTWSLHQLHRWPANVFREFSALRFTPTLTAIIVLVAIGITVGSMKVISPPDNTLALRNESAAVILPSPDESSKVADPVNRAENKTGSEAESKAEKAVPRQVMTLNNEAKKVKAVLPTSDEDVRRTSRKPSLLVHDQTPDQLIRDAEQKYLRAIAMLSHNVSRRRSRLDPETALRFEQTLAAVDRTIAGTRRAVRENPEDPVAIQYMLMAYAKKVDVLRQMTVY